MVSRLAARLGARSNGSESNPLPVSARPTPAAPRAARSRHAEFLPDLEAIAEREHSPYARHLALATTLLFAVLIAWASFAKLDQVTTASGDVRPAGKVKVINHPEGGNVAVLKVRDGDRVKAGDKLVELDARIVEQELARFTAEWQSLSAEIARLEAESGHRELRFDAELAAARPDLVREQTHQYLEDRRALESGSGIGQERIAQAKSALAAVEKKIVQLEQGVRLSVEQERAVAELTDKGYFPRIRYLAIKRQLSDDEGQLAQAREERQRAEAAVAEAERTSEQSNAEHDAKLLERLGQARIEQGRAFRGMNEQEAKRTSLLITAPVAGIVQNLAVASAGQSVKPSEPIMNIVPTGDTLVVEVRVPNADIGYIKIGQPATVKIATYPYVRFGSLEGKVESIAADANRDEKTGQTYFNVQVRTGRTYLGGRPDQYPVNPGMQASVDLHIGKRTILSYLTERFVQKLGSALREP